MNTIVCYVRYLNAAVWEVGGNINNQCLDANRVSRWAAHAFGLMPMGLACGGLLCLLRCLYWPPVIQFCRYLTRVLSAYTFFGF